MKSARAIILTAILAIGIMCGLLVFSRVPYDATKQSGWYFADIKANEVHNLRTSSLMVARARLDQFLFPIPETTRLPGPVAVTESGDAIYIVFFESLEGHRFVIYCASKTSHRLLWKAMDSNPA
jgi:hypothetical protein